MKKHTQRMALSALFAVFLAIFSWISIPTPFGVPVTLQIFGVALCGFVLGARAGLGSVLVYLLLGAVGLPVFSFFQGGIGILTSASGGFLFGFIILVLLCGIKTLCKLKFALPSIGLLLCHTVGVLQFCLVTGTGAISGILTASLPFILKDAILIFLAAKISKRIRLEKFYD